LSSKYGTLGAYCTSAAGSPVPPFAGSDAEALNGKAQDSINAQDYINDLVQQATVVQQPHIDSCSSALDTAIASMAMIGNGTPGGLSAGLVVAQIDNAVKIGLNLP
ncbi:MAG: hypothetical protein RXR52_31695, partial [Paraburkholderia sp.]